LPCFLYLPPPDFRAVLPWCWLLVQPLTWRLVTAQDAFLIISQFSSLTTREKEEDCVLTAASISAA
jgi:hypothetical protein